MEVNTTILIQRDKIEIELYVFGDAEPYTSPNFSGHPDDWTPGEGGVSCVEGVFLDKECEVRWTGTLTKEEISRAESALMGALEDGLRCSAESAAEDRAESMADDAAYDYDCDITNDPYGYY